MTSIFTDLVYIFVKGTVYIQIDVGLKPVGSVLKPDEG